MARIRTIKPEFFTSEDICELTPLARMFYIALWCEADREGRLSWKPKTLKIRYLPTDECNTADLARELEMSGLVMIYEVDGKQYAEIPSFKHHQVINNREAASVLPARVKVASTRVQGEGRKEGKGREGKTRQSTRPPDVFPVTTKMKSYAKSKGVPLACLEDQTEKFLVYHRAKGSKFVCWYSAWQNWLGNYVKWQSEDKPADPLGGAI